MREWSLNVTAKTRAEGLEKIARAVGLPTFARDHLVGLVRGEAYVHNGRPNPEATFQLFARGEDHGAYITIEAAGVYYFRSW